MVPRFQEIDDVVDVRVALQREVGDEPVPQILDETVEVMKLVPRERVQQRIVEQIVECQCHKS